MPTLNDLGYYLSGFTDGEGSFCVYFSPRIRMNLGWEVRPSFSVGQNTSRPEVLNLFLQYFKCGSLRPNRGDNTVKFEIRSSSHEGLLAATRADNRRGEARKDRLNEIDLRLVCRIYSPQVRGAKGTAILRRGSPLRKAAFEVGC